MHVNPLIPGFHPDPSVCRVGDTYYLATSTFEYLPGIPVFRSTDLREVELIGHVATRPGQLGVEGVPTNGGAWAPTIRHHDGKFWVVVPDMLGTGRGNVLFTSDDPAGPWSDGIVMEVPGIDPDIAWDEAGNCYVTASVLRLDGATGKAVHEGIQQVRIDPATGRALEPMRQLWSGTGGMFPEAPHLYHIGEWWYLLIAEGGTERGHAVTIARSVSPEGPFEGCPHNPLVTARSTDRPVQNTGHGDLVQLADGSWAMVLLGTRPRSGTRAFAPMGRETFITAVRWEDAWPVVEPVQLDSRHAPVSRDWTPADGLDGEFIAVRRFPAEAADLSVRPGAARLRGDGNGMAAAKPAFFGVRQCAEQFTISATFDVSAGVGGLSIRYDEAAHFDIEADATTVTATMHAYGLLQSWTRPRSGGGLVELRLSADPDRPGLLTLASCDRISAQVREDGDWVEVGVVDGRFLSSEVCESFTGRVAGPYARSGVVDVLALGYTGQDVQR